MNNMNLDKIIEEMKFTVYLFVLVAAVLSIITLLGYSAYKLYLSL
jgi:hypothetical protein